MQQFLRFPFWLSLQLMRVFSQLAFLFFLSAYHLGYLLVFFTSMPLENGGDVRVGLDRIVLMFVAVLSDGIVCFGKSFFMSNNFLHGEGVLFVFG